MAKPSLAIGIAKVNTFFESANFFIEISYFFAEIFASSEKVATLAIPFEKRTQRDH